MSPPAQSRPGLKKNPGLLEDCAVEGRGDGKNAMPRVGPGGKQYMPIAVAAAPGGTVAEVIQRMEAKAEHVASSRGYGACHCCAFAAVCSGTMGQMQAIPLS